MARISRLQTLIEVTGEEFLPVVFNGQNFRIRLKDFKTILNKTDVGLGNVDNTADLSKPISVAMQSALNQRAPLTHSHATGELVGINELIHEHIVSMQLEDTIDIGVPEW